MKPKMMVLAFMAVQVSYSLQAANPSYKWTGKGGDFLWSTAANWENTATQAAEVPVAGSKSGDGAVDFDFTDLPANATLTNDVTTKYCIRHLTFGASKGTQRIAPKDATTGIAQYFTNKPSTMTVPTGTTVDFALNHPKDNDDYYAVVEFKGGGTFRWSAETALWPKQLALVIHDATVVVASAVADFTSVNVLLKSSSSTFELENDLTIGHLAGADVACASAGRVVLNGHALKIASGTVHYNSKWYKNAGDIQAAIEGTGSVTYSGGTSMTNRFAHTFTGTVRLLNADVATAVDAAFPSDNTLAIDSNGRLSLGGNQTVAALTGDGVTGGIEIPSGKKLSVTGSVSGAKSYRAQLSGAGEFEKNGADTLVLSGVNTLSGKTSVKAGTLAVVGSAAPVVAETSLYCGYRFEDELVDDAGNGTVMFSYNDANIYGKEAAGDKDSSHENETNTAFCVGRNGTRGIEMFDGAGASVMYKAQSGQPFALGNGPFTATVWMIPSENMKNKKNRSGTNRTWSDNNAIFFFGSGANTKLNSFKVYTTAGTHLNFSAGGYYLGDVTNNVSTCDYGFTCAASDFLDGQWHMVTVTYDGAGTIAGYYDGRPVGMKTLPTGESLNLNGRCHLGWGNYGNLSGKFDDFKILSRCQTAAEIAAEFKGEVPAGDDFAALPAPVAKWTFDDPVNPGKDTSGNGYDLSAASGCTAASVDVPGAFGKTLARGSAMTCSTFPVKIPTGAASFTLSVRYLFNAGDADKTGKKINPSVVRWGKENTANQFFSAVVDYYENYRAFYPALKIQQEKYSTVDRRVDEISLSTLTNSPAAWTHVVYTYSTTGGLKIYQDGCERYSGWKPTSVNIQGQDLFIGLRPAYSDGATVPFPGFIDDVRIWDSELTAEQIVTLTRGLETGANPSPLSADSTLDIAAGASVEVSGTGVAAKEIAGSGALNVTSNASFTVGGGTLSTLAGHGQLTTTAPLKIANASAYYGNLILNDAGSLDAPTYTKTVSLPENYTVTLASVDSLPILRTGGKATFPAAGSIDFVTHPTADGEYLVAEAADLTMPASLAAWQLDAAYCAQGHFKMKLYVRDGKVYLRVRKVRGMVMIFR